MDETEPLVDGTANFVPREAQHGFPAVGKVDVARPEIPVPQPVVGASHGECIAFDSRPETLFGEFLVCDVHAGRHVVGHDSIRINKG